MITAAHIAWRELRHEWLASLCFVAALIGGLAPLLVVLALKNGVIDGMVDRLVEDPSNRELIAMGAGRHPPALFAQLARRADVGFVMPATRSINAQANGMRNLAGRQIEQAVTLIPSAEGDPLLAGAVPFVQAGAVVLSAALAETLQVEAGGAVEMLIGREIDGRREAARGTFAVLAVLPPERYGRKAAFVALPDLLAVERFRDDAAIPSDAWQSQVAEPAFYASFRLYARRLEDLAPLAAALRESGIETRLRAENAALLLGFHSTLGLLYAGIAGLALAGFWAAMAANLRGMVARQRQTFSLLSLVGMTDGSRRLVPLIQALALVATGLSGALIVVGAMTATLNRVFEPSTGTAVARLGVGDLLAVLGIGLATALTASVWALWAIDRIGPGDVLREG